MGKMRPNVCLIWLDTLRWDYAARVTALAQVMDKGLFFERIYGPATFSRGVVSSLRAGMYPPRHGHRAWQKPTGRFKEERIFTLGQFLVQAGYHMGSTLGVLKPGQITWPIIEEKARFSSAVKKSPSFVYAHNNWLHNAAYSALGWIPAQQKERGNLTGLPVETYSSFMSKVSKLVERVFDRYREFGMFDDTIFIAMSDHGIGIRGDRDGVGAGFIHDARTRVTCTIFGPGIKPKYIKGPSSLIDILPTLLDVLNIPCVPPKGKMQAQGFSALQEVLDRFVYIEAQTPFGKWPSPWPNVFGATDGKIKVMLTPDGTEVYDLIKDPREEDNRPELAQTDRGQDLVDFMHQIKSEGDK